MNFNWNSSYNNHLFWSQKVLKGFINYIFYWIQSEGGYNFDLYQNSYGESQFVSGRSMSSARGLHMDHGVSGHSLVMVRKWPLSDRAFFFFFCFFVRIPNKNLSCLKFLIDYTRLFHCLPASKKRFCFMAGIGGCFIVSLHPQNNSASWLELGAVHCLPASKKISVSWLELVILAMLSYYFSLKSSRILGIFQNF